MTCDEPDPVELRLTRLSTSGASLFVEENTCNGPDTRHIKELVGWIAIEPFEDRCVEPSPSSSKTPARTPRPTRSRTPERTSSKTAARTPRPTRSRTPEPTASRTAARTPRPTRSRTAARTPRPTRSSTPEPTASRTAARTPRPTRSSTPQPTSSKTAMRTPRPTRTPTPTPSASCVNRGHPSSGPFHLSSTERTINTGAVVSSSVVVHGVPSYRGSDPVVVRTRVGTTSVKFVLQEPPCNDGPHTTETVSGYIAIPPGVYRTGSNTFLQADNFHLRDEGFFRVNFRTPFPAGSEIVVVATLASTNEKDFAKVRILKVTNTFFLAGIEEEEGLQPHKTETMSWVATFAGKGTLFGSKFEADTARIGSTIVSKHFQTSFKAAPIFLSSIMTCDEEDAVQLRLPRLTKDDFKVFVEENKCVDPETHHIKELVGWIALEPFDFNRCPTKY